MVLANKWGKGWVLSVYFWIFWKGEKGVTQSLFWFELSRAALLLNFWWLSLLNSPHATAGIAGVRELQRLLRTFLSLRISCQQAKVTFYSDRDGDCHVILKVTTPRNWFQSPCRGGAHSRSQEKQGSCARNPPPVSERVSATQKTSSASAPAPARRSRRRGPAAILRNKQRQLGCIEPDVLLPNPALPLAPRRKGSAPALPPPAPTLFLVRKERKGAPALPTPAPALLQAPRKEAGVPALHPFAPALLQTSGESDEDEEGIP